MTVPPAQLLPPAFPREGGANDHVTLNIAARLTRLAAERPQQTAVLVPHANTGPTSLSFAELEALSNRYANALASVGLERGMRTLLMVRPGVDFFALTFALFKLGALPVMIDPGMGAGRMLACIRQVDLRGFVGIPLAHVMRVLRRGSFRSIKHVITVGRRWFWGGHSLKPLAARASDSFSMADTRQDDPAAILFTSGSTGPAKGVVYEHGMFDAQVRLIQSHYGIEPGEVDVPTFPLFALFSVAMGMTAVIPDMDASRPAKADPAKVVAAIQRHQATSTFGSPALWRRVAPYCIERGVKLPTLRRILIAGAPVPHDVIDQLHQVIGPQADIFTPYGATEALPVASVAGRERCPVGEPRIATPKAQTRMSESTIGNRQSTIAAVSATRTLPPGLARGTCVGFPFDEIDVTIIRITDEPIHHWSDDLLVEDGEVGELVVTGPSVTKEYFGLPRANALSKIHEGETLWHRMGDLGYRDEDGRLWFCGRKAHRVETSTGTLFTECIEPVFNEHPDVSRSALVGVGPRRRQHPVIVIELRSGRTPPESPGDSPGQKLIAWAQQISATDRRARGLVPIDNPSFTRRGKDPQPVLHAQSPGSTIDNQLSLFLDHSPAVLFHKSLPVDARHNAKINREALAAWAARKLP